MNKLTNCLKCGKLFMTYGRDVCPACVEAEENAYELVKKYIDTHPGCSVQEVAVETGVPVEKIFKYLREGSLISSNLEASEEIACISCGKPIPGGRLCEVCAKKMSDDIAKVTKPVENQPQKKSVMYTRSMRDR